MMMLITDRRQSKWSGQTVLGRLKKYLYKYKLHNASLCGLVGKDFVYHACGHEFESRLKWTFRNFPHHLWLFLSD